MNHNPNNGRGDDTLRQRPGDQFDVATIVVRVTDVNDHAPEFRAGSCYPLAIPESNETAVVHTVVATDLDEGANGVITYSIAGKYNLWRFQVLGYQILYFPEIHSHRWQLWQQVQHRFAHRPTNGTSTGS